MIRFLWALVLLVVSVTPVAGQTLSAAAFLSSAKDDLRVRNHRELLDYLASAARDTPYIDRIELRTETDNFDILRQRYALRVYPRGWGETSSARNVHYARSIAKRYEQRRLLIDALAERYELLLEYVEVKQLIALYQSLLATIGDGIAVLRRLTGVVQSRIDLNPLLTAEDRYVDLQLDLVRLEDRMTSVSHKVLALAKGAKQIGFSADQLKDVQSIAAVARELAKSKATPNNVDLETRRAEVGLAQARYRLEVARQHDYLSYLALEYDTQFRDSSQRAFSLNLGIKLPFIRRDSDDIDRRKTAHLSEKLRYAQAVYRARERQRSVLSSLERLVRQHDILIRRKTTGDAKTSFERYRKMEGIDPLALLRLKQSIIEGDIRVVRLERSIRTRFVQLLVLLGRLDGPPLTNQLSRAGERLFGGLAVRLERLELKYTIPLSLVDAIADYASCYCSPDKYSPEGGGYYTVNSLYLDSPGFALLKNRLERRANRVNLRIRSYGELADPPYHLEIKQKVGSVVRKYRATVADDPGTLLESDMLDRADVARDDRENLELFALLHASYGLEPKVLMTYRRRALNSDVDDYARVTFDTELRCAWRDRYRLTHDAGEFSACDLPEFYDPGCSVVLELKCYAAHLPCWMLDLVKQFSLRRRSFSKYLAAAAQTTTAARYAGDRRSSAVWL